MSDKRDPDAIVAAWLEEGPTRLPDATRRAIEVSIRTTHKSRLPWLTWRAPHISALTRLAFAAVAVVAVVVGGLSVLGPGTDRSGGVGGAGASVPSASPAPSNPASPGASIPVMTQPFVSPKFGYSIRYPAGWIVTPTSRDGPTSDGADTFDPVGGAARFRGLSVALPDGVVVDDWIAQQLTHSPDADCARPRQTLESVTIDGHAGRLRGFCGVPPAPEIEATVVVDKRVYLFTFFDFREGTANEEAARAMFDAFATTITLDPGGAEGSPNPSPS